LEEAEPGPPPNSTLYADMTGAPVVSIGTLGLGSTGERRANDHPRSVVADVVSFVFSFSGFACAMAAGCLWLLLEPRSNPSRRFLVIATVVYVVASTYVVSHTMGRLLATGYRPLDRADVPPGRSALVVLGSGSFTAKDWHDNKYSVVDPTAATRVLEAVRVDHFVHPEWIISSGGIVRKEQYAATGATMRDALVQLGVPAARVIVETESSNTREEALIVRPILASLHVSNVILVTSETHMRRSVGAFRAVGVHVIPAIARDPYAAGDWIEWLEPSALGLAQANSVAHEVIGLGYYALRGWYRF
jgi:uncharacterized SAM-binding protein YcdF (DUF218 family)